LLERVRAREAAIVIVGPFMRVRGMREWPSTRRGIARIQCPRILPWTTGFDGTWNTLSNAHADRYRTGCGGGSSGGDQGRRREATHLLDDAVRVRVL